MSLAVVLFASALIAIATDRVDRTKVALTGAVLMLLTQTITEHQAIESVHWNTLGLLAGMMIMVKLTEATGVFTWMAIRAGQLSRGNPPAVVACLTIVTMILSAFLDNITTVLLIVPITFLLADALDLDPIPLVIIEIVLSNIGGTATLIGDPPNIMIAGATGLSFMAFIENLAPIVLVTAVIVTTGLYFHYRERLQVKPQARAHVMSLDARKSIEDLDELKRCGPVLLATIALFFAHQQLHLEPATVALAGATAMLLISRQPLERTLQGVEWPTLFFFIGLFVMVGALEQVGAIEEAADWIIGLTDGDRSAELLGIVWMSAVGGALVDNIPFTATMIPIVEQLEAGRGDEAYWWALALGACFSGNATLVAAGANVAAAGMAARAGTPIRFLEFLKVGLPVTFISMLIVTAYVSLRYI